MGDRPRIVICIPYYGDSWSDLNRRNVFYFVFRQLKHHSDKYDILYVENKGTYLHESRETLATQALKEKPDYLFFLDADNQPPDDVFDRLIARDKDVVSGLYFTRGEPYTPVAYNWKIIKGGNQAFPFAIDPIPDDDATSGNLIPVGAVGFGSVLIKASVFEKVPKPWFRCIVPGSEHMGEDVAFCQHAFFTGISIHVDTSVKVDHLAYDCKTVSPNNFMILRNACDGVPARMTKDDISQLFQTLFARSDSGFLTTKEGNCLYDAAARTRKGEFIVEIGSWKGKSTIWLAHGLKSGEGEKVVAIDPFTGEGEIADALKKKVYTLNAFYRNVMAARCNDVIIPCASRSEDTNGLFKNLPLGVLFIDGAHDRASAERDFKMWSPQVVPGGYIAMHDAYPESAFDGARTVAKEFMLDRREDYESVEIVDSIVIAKVKEK